MATVVLGDDHVVFLDALSTVLSQHGHIVCGVARSAAEMVTLVSVHQPDACLIDHNAPEGEDAETIRKVLAACAGTSVIVLGASSRSDAVDRALDAGATGYLHQSRRLGALVSALERVLDGETVIDVPDAPSARRSAEPNLELRMASHLTSRERECLMMLVEGLDTAAMVDLLGVSRTTFDAATRGLEPDLTLPELVLPGRPEKPSGAQPEFVLTPADYIKEPAIEQLAVQGRKLAAQYRDVLAAVERQFGVPGNIVLAILRL